MLAEPGLPGQPMYYVVPAKAASAEAARKFVEFATSPEIQAEGIVKRFNWYPGIDAEHVQPKLDEATWNKLFTDVKPDELASKGSRPPHTQFNDILETTSARSPTEDWSIRDARYRCAGLGACSRSSGWRRRSSRWNADVSSYIPWGSRWSFSDPVSGVALGNFIKAFELYGTDILFTLVIVGLSTGIIALARSPSAATWMLGECAPAVAILRWLYRWPLFIPFVVAGQIMRSFLAKNGLMNHALIELGPHRCRARASSTGAASSWPSCGSRPRSSR